MGHEKLPQSVEAHPFPEGHAWKSCSTVWRQGPSQTVEGTPGWMRDLSIRWPFAIDANHQGVTLLPTSLPQPWPWSADSWGPTLARAAPPAGFPVHPGVYCHQRLGVRIVANGASTPRPPSSGGTRALVHTGQRLTPGSRVSHHPLVLSTPPPGSCFRCQRGWSTPLQSALLSV